jgi:hypothetical protein
MSLKFYWRNYSVDPVMMDKNTSIEQLLSFYMGKNTPDRQIYHQEFEGGVGRD